MNERSEGSFEVLNIIRRTFRGSFLAVGLTISAAGFMWEGLFLYSGIIFGTIIIAAGFSEFPNALIDFVSRRRGESYLRVFALIMPLLLTASSLVIPIFLYLGSRAGIPLFWNHRVASLLLFLAGLISLGVFLSNIFALVRGRTNP